MKLNLLLAAPLLLAAQSDKLPRADPLPPPGSEAAEVMVPVDRMLGALEKSDGATILAVTRPEGGATVAFEGAAGKRGVRHFSWAEFAAGLKPDGDRFQERIFDPAIEVDGDIAFVWARFTVLKNGAAEHCGYDLFDLVRENGVWKVLNVTWSQRTTGCAAQ